MSPVSIGRYSDVGSWQAAMLIAVTMPAWSRPRPDAAAAAAPNAGQLPSTCMPRPIRKQRPSGHPPRSRSPGRGEGGRDPTPTPGAKGRPRPQRPACRAPARVLLHASSQHAPSPAPWPPRRPRAVEAGAVGIIAKSLRVEPVANHRRTTAGDRAAEGVEDQPACAGLDVRGQPAGTSIDQLTQHDCGHRPPHIHDSPARNLAGILTWNVAGRDLAVQPTARTAVALLQDPPRPQRLDDRIGLLQP